MWSKEEQAVLAFQAKIGAQAPKGLEKPISETIDQISSTGLLLGASLSLQYSTAKLKAGFRAYKDQRLLRAELLVEELSELIKGLAEYDEIAVLDGLADVLYVTIGTGTTYNLPAMDAFWPVHVSNMSKDSGAKDHDGNKGKCETYFPPDVRPCIVSHRIYGNHILEE